MKVFSIILIFIIPYFSIAQGTITGDYQGLLKLENTTWSQGQAFYMRITAIAGLIDGESREEVVGENTFINKKVLGSFENKKSFEITQNTILKSSNGSANTCLLSMSFHFVDSNAYWVGTFKSQKCPSMKGSLILYKTRIELDQDPTPLHDHRWVTRFQEDLEFGLSAPEKRPQELKNFAFQSIYFEYNKDEIPSNYFSYLNLMARMILGHSDLRIKVVGNTDSDGSKPYNLDLSKRRAEAITSYFISKGLSKDRIVISYDGENKPKDTNKTAEGKKRNRRVDFSFI